MNDLLEMLEGSSDKIYYCDNYLCIASECKKGKRVIGIEKGETIYREVEEGFGFIKEIVRREPHVVFFENDECLKVKEFSGVITECNKEEE